MITKVKAFLIFQGVWNAAKKETIFKACSILRDNGTFAKIAEEEGVTPEMAENTFKKMMEE